MRRHGNAAGKSAAVAWRHRTCEFSTCEAMTYLTSASFSVARCVSGNTRIDNLRVAEPTQTSCWMQVLHKSAPVESSLIGPLRVGAPFWRMREENVYATGHAAPAAILSRTFADSRQGLQTWSESRERCERYDHARMRRLLYADRLGTVSDRSSRFIPRANQ